MSMTFYLSIVTKILAAISIVSLIYLVIAFVKNVGFTKYLTRQDIDQLYNYQWSSEEIETLNLIIVNRKTIFKLITVFALVAMFSISINVFLNDSKTKNVEDIEGILTATYCNDISDINKELDKYKKTMSDDVYSQLTADNIDNINSRYANISTKSNEIRIINSISSGNEKYVDFQIINNGLVASNRRVFIRYINGIIGYFEETLQVPVTLMDNSKIDFKKEVEEDNASNKEEVNTNEVSEKNDASRLKNTTDTEMDNLSQDDIF